MHKNTSDRPSDVFLLRQTRFFTRKYSEKTQKTTKNQKSVGRLLLKDNKNAKKLNKSGKNMLKSIDNRVFTCYNHIHKLTEVYAGEKRRSAAVFRWEILKRSTNK